MKLVSALVGLAALRRRAFSSAPASAMPVADPDRPCKLPTSSRPLTSATHGAIAGTSHYDGDGYYHPHYYGGWGWHHWHHWNRYYSGW